MAYLEAWFLPDNASDNKICFRFPRKVRKSSHRPRRQKVSRYMRDFLFEEVGGGTRSKTRVKRGAVLEAKRAGSPTVSATAYNQHMKTKKWTLLSKKDVSPNKWFPIESRTYQLPNGTIVDDFTVSTIADVAMIVPITFDHQIVLVNQYKPGADDVILEFPAGRLDENHQNLADTAQQELEEETGIKVNKNQLTHFATLHGFTTKATEKVHIFLADDCHFNASQKLDATEDIEVITVSVAEMEQKITDGTIWAAQTIAAFYVAKLKYPEIFTGKNESHHT